MSVLILVSMVTSVSCSFLESFLRMSQSHLDLGDQQRPRRTGNSHNRLMGRIRSLQPRKRLSNSSSSHMSAKNTHELVARRSKSPTKKGFGTLGSDTINENRRPYVIPTRCSCQESSDCAIRVSACSGGV